MHHRENRPHNKLVFPTFPRDWPMHDPPIHIPAPDTHTPDTLRLPRIPQTRSSLGRAGAHDPGLPIYDLVWF